MMTRIDRVKLAAEKVENCDLSQTQAAIAYSVDTSEITEELASQAKEDSDFIQEMCSRL